MAKSKFTESQRQQLAELVVSASQKTVLGKEVEVNCVDKEAGKTAHAIIAAAYPKYKFDYADSIWGNVLAWGAIPGGSWTTGNWKTFRVRTGSKSQASALAKELMSCIDEYGGTVGLSGIGSGDDGTDRGGLTKTMLYFIIGAVVAVVVAFVLTRKKQ